MAIVKVGVYEILIDDDKVEWFKQYKWRVHGATKPYVYRHLPMENGKVHDISLHRELLGLVYMDGKFADHINGNIFDNRLINLRICTSQQNNQNCGKHKNNTSGLKGVSWDKRLSKWRAQIQINKKVEYLGNYATKEEARAIYVKTAKKYFGEFMREE